MRKRKSSVLFEHDRFGKTLTTVPDHAPVLLHLNRFIPSSRGACASKRLEG
jgi:hypothetical protein